MCAVKTGSISRTQQSASAPRSSQIIPITQSAGSSDVRNARYCALLDASDSGRTLQFSAGKLAVPTRALSLRQQLFALQLACACGTHLRHRHEKDREDAFKNRVRGASLQSV